MKKKKKKEKDVEKVEYDYGSRPKESYSYKDFVKHLAPKLPENDEVFLPNGSDKWRKDHNKIPFKLFKDIYHWKSRQRLDYTDEYNGNKVNTHWKKALQYIKNGDTADAVKELISLKGIGVPRASALLTAWDPENFGIIDKNVCKVIYKEKKEITPELYDEYINKLRKLKKDHTELNNCAIRQIELAIWHYYRIQEQDTAKRNK